MRRWRNGDVEIQTLRREIVEDPSDLNLRIALSRSLQRSGVGVEDPEVAVGVIASNLDSGLIGIDRVHMGARVGYGPAQVVGTALGETVGVGLDWANWGQRRTIIEILDQLEIVSLAADFAESVLGIFESHRPGDDRPRKAIEAARRWALRPTQKNEAAARAADAAATDAAYAAAAAADAAAYAAYAAAADAAARAAGIPHAETYRLQLSRYLCYLLKLDPACILPPVKKRKSRSKAP